MERTPLRVLLVEDDEDDFVLVRDLLQEITNQSYYLDWAKTYDEALLAMEEDHHDVYLIDYRLDAHSGLELIREAFERRDCHAPIIFLTGQGDDEVDMEVMRAGAEDYLVKGQVNAALLERSIRHSIGRKRTEEALRRVHDELERRVEERTRELSLLNAAMRDEITERKRTEEALRESEARYRTVLEANPDPVVVYDSNGKVSYFNPAFTRIFGWSLEERLEKEMDKFVPEENRPEIMEMLKAIQAGESISDVETSRYTRSGLIVPVIMSGAVYRDGEGNPLGSVLNYRDIRRQKKLEAELLHAQKMEAIGTLAGGIAHEFNNLLQMVQGCADLMLLKMKEGEPCLQEIHYIITAAQRGAELTRQLLIFSLTEESRLSPLDMNLEIEKATRLLRQTLPRMIEIEVHQDVALKYVNADSAQIQQILLNLALNARDAMPEGGRLIIETRNVTLAEKDCRTNPGLSPGAYALLVVSDTGCGIDRETLMHIFEPFYTTKGFAKGTGLGLSVVYGIVENHGGMITCSSAVGEGATFQIFFPAVEQKMTRSHPLSEDLPRGAAETILLVDDENIILEMVCEVLEKSGYRVVTAPDGEKALNIYRNEPGHFDLVVLDLIMPRMGGRKCMEEILRINPQARILVASGYSDAGPIKEVIAAGAGSFISKPYVIKQLLGEVRRMLDQAQAYR